MANCNCNCSNGSTYATVNRGYGCLSSVPTASGIPYNCFLPPTNMSYYQNYPFYNGPCGAAQGSPAPSGGCGVWPRFNPCCCNGSSEPESESMTSGGSSGCGCWNPCKPCNSCCGPAALVATSSGNLTPAANSAVPLVQSTSISSNITVDGNNIIFHCPGVYLVTLNSNIPATPGYGGNVSLALNGQTLGTTTQTFTSGAAANNTTQAIVRVAENSTLSVMTSAVGTQLTPTAGTNLFTVSVVRIA